MRTYSSLIIATLAAVPALAQSPYTAADQTWLSLSGAVESVAADSFVLDYGDGSITVEVDDWDNYQEGKYLKQGDKVMVSGKVDDDLYETASIEAASIYIENLGTHFMAPSPTDEETLRMTTVVPVVTVSTVTLNGTVQDVGKTSFTIDTGEQSLTLDVGGMANNPLDSTGFLKVDKGDRLIVSGTIDQRFFGDRRLEVDSIVEIEPNNTAKGSQQPNAASENSGQPS